MVNMLKGITSRTHYYCYIIGLTIDLSFTMHFEKPCKNSKRNINYNSSRNFTSNDILKQMLRSYKYKCKLYTRYKTIFSSFTNILFDMDLQICKGTWLSTVFLRNILRIKMSRHLSLYISLAFCNNDNSQSCSSCRYFRHVHFIKIRMPYGLFCR